MSQIETVTKEDVLRMRALAFSVIKIARFYDMEQKTVNKIIKEAGPSLFCDECDNPTSEYIYFPLCADCQAKDEHASERDLRDIMLNRSVDISRRSSNRGLDYNAHGFYLYNLFKAQNGICAFTGRVMNFSQEHELPSVEKIIPAKGYTRGNIIFTTKRSNSIKSDLTLPEMKRFLPTWFNNLTAFINTHDIVTVEEKFYTEERDDSHHPVNTMDDLYDYYNSRDFNDPVAFEELAAAHQDQNGICAITGWRYCISVDSAIRNSVVVKRNKKGEIILISDRAASIMGDIIDSHYDMAEISPEMYANAVDKELL